MTTTQYLAGFSPSKEGVSVSGLITSIPTTYGTVDYANVVFSEGDAPDTTLTNSIWNVKAIKNSATSGTIIAQLVSSGTTPSAGGGTMYFCSVFNSTKTSWNKVGASSGSYAEIVNPSFHSGGSRDDIIALATSSLTFIPSVLLKNSEAPQEYGNSPYAIEVWKNTNKLVAHSSEMDMTFTCYKDDNEGWSTWEKLITSAGGEIGQLITTVDDDTPALCSDGDDKGDATLILSSGANPSINTNLMLKHSNSDTSSFTLKTYSSGTRVTRELIGRSDIGDTANGLTWCGYDVITGAGGTMQQELKFAKSWGGLGRIDNNDYLQLNGYVSASGKGSSLVLSGAESTSSTWGKGNFGLRATNTSGTSCSLIGKPDGALTWGSNDISGTPTSVSVTNGTNISGTCTCYKVGHMAFVWGNMWATAEKSADDVIVSGLPRPIVSSMGVSFPIGYYSTYNRGNRLKFKQSSGTGTIYADTEGLAKDYFVFNFCYICE